MARVFNLVYGATTINLLTGPLKLAASGFSFASSNEGTVWDTVRLVGSTTDAGLRTAIAQLDDFFERAEQYASSNFESQPVWLYWQTDGESAKRYIVFGGGVSIVADDTNTPLLGVGYVAVDVAILRGAEGENDTESTFFGSGISADGGTWAPGVGAGTYPARISKLTITASTVPSLSKLWVGIKPTRNGNAGFISLWQAELGTNFLDAADAADASASGGSKVAVSFALYPTMQRRLTISWDNIASANFDDIIGEYLVLCRCKVDAATTEVAIKLAHGWAGLSGQETPVGITYISGTTNWYLNELGTVQIPPTGNRGSVASTGDEIKHYFLSFSAERLSAAGSLDIDCVILVPTEHLLIIDRATISAGVGSRVEAFSPNADAPYALYKTAAGGLYGNVEYSFNNWGYPVGGGLFVVVGQGANSHALSNLINLDLALAYRWRSYRV